MSESFRDLIKKDIQTYEEGLGIEQKSTGNASRPEMKVVKISMMNRLSMMSVRKTRNL